MPQDIKDGTLQKSKDQLFRQSRNTGNTDDGNHPASPLLAGRSADACSSNSKNTSEYDEDQRQDRQFKKTIERYLGDLFHFDKFASGVSDPISDKINDETDQSAGGSEMTGKFIEKRWYNEINNSIKYIFAI